MALSRQQTQVTWRGLDTKADPKTALVGTFETLHNAYFDRTGEIKTRPGSSSLTLDTESGGTISAGSELGNRGDELLLRDKSRWMAYDPHYSKWRDRGAAALAKAEGTLLYSLPAPAQGTTSKVVSGGVLNEMAAAAPNGNCYVEYDCATDGNVTLVVSQLIGKDYVATQPLTYSIVDNSTRKVLHSHAFGSISGSAAVGFNCKALYYENNFYVFFEHGAISATAGSIYAARIPITTGNIADGNINEIVYRPRVTTTGWDKYGGPWDVIVDSEKECIVVAAYGVLLGTPVTWVLTVDPADVSVGTVTYSETYVADTGMGFLWHTTEAIEDSPHLVIGVSDGASGKEAGVFTIDRATWNINAAAWCQDVNRPSRHLTGVVQGAAGTNIRLLWEDSRTDNPIGYYKPYNHVVHSAQSSTWFTPGSEPIESVLCRSVGLGSRCWAFDSDPDVFYVTLNYGSDWTFTNDDGVQIPQTQRYAFVARLTENATTYELDEDEYNWPYLNGCQFVASLFAGDGGGLVHQFATLPNVVPVGTVGLSDAAVTVAPRQMSEICGVRHLSMAFLELYDGWADVGRPLDCLNTTLLPGAAAKMFDGECVTEHGFYHAPEAPSLSQGSSTAYCYVDPGTYLYVVVARWIDAFGDVHRSRPSAPSSVTVTGDKQYYVYVVCPTLRVTDRAQEFSTVTPDEPVILEIYRTTAGGTQFHYCGFKENDVNADEVNFKDIIGDSSLVQNEFLYTNGGVLDNSPVPALSVIERHRDAIAAIDLWGSVWISKPQELGTTWGFNDNLQIFPDFTDGRPVALVSMEERLVIGKERALSYVSGSGPDALGVGMFEYPAKLSGEIGFATPRGWARLPGGVLFQSQQGIYSLSLGLSFEFAGSPVNRNTSGGTIYTVETVENAAQLRFQANNYTVLVYDWFHKQWSTWDTYGGGAMRASAKYGGQYAVVDTSGRVWRETAGACLDVIQGVSSTAYAMTVKLANLNLAGLAGFARLWEIEAVGEFASAGDGVNRLFAMSLFHDNNATAAETLKLTVSSEHKAGQLRMSARPAGQKVSGLGIQLTNVISAAATGSITCVDKAYIANNEAVTIGDGVHTPSVFEFKVNGSFVATPTRVTVDISADTTAAQVAARLKTAINNVGAGLTVTAGTITGATLALTNDAVGYAGNVTITDTVASGDFVTVGMRWGAGGVSEYPYTLSGLTLVYGQKRGVEKLGAVNRMAPTT